MPPPAPASVPQVNCPVASSQRSLEEASAHADNPAPVNLPAMFWFVVVAFVPVEFVIVTVARLERPETVRLARVPTEVRDDETTFEARVVPVIAVPETDPAEPVTFPVRFPEAEVKKRLVVEAVVAKKLVVVALVVVLLVTMMSVRPLRVERLLRVVVAARAVSNRAWV